MADRRKVNARKSLFGAPPREPSPEPSIDSSTPQPQQLFMNDAASVTPSFNQQRTEAGLSFNDASSARSLNRMPRGESPGLVVHSPLPPVSSVPIPLIRLAASPSDLLQGQSPHTPNDSPPRKQPPPSPTPTRPKHISRSPQLCRTLSTVRESSPFDHFVIDDVEMKEDPQADPRGLMGPPALPGMSANPLASTQTLDSATWQPPPQFSVLLERTVTPDTLVIDSKAMADTEAVLKKRPQPKSRRGEPAAESTSARIQSLRPPNPAQQLPFPGAFAAPQLASDRWLESRHNPFSPWKGQPKAANSAVMLLPSQVHTGDVSRIVTDYSQESTLGRGSFGEVILAQNRVDGWKYAIKKVPWLSNKQLEFRLREAYALAAIGFHPNIIRYYSTWIEEKEHVFYIQTEYCTYGNLRNWCRTREWTEVALCDLLKQIASALSYMHNTKRFAHLDVKPDNIFVTPANGENDSAGVIYKLGDLGLLLQLDKGTVEDLEDIELGDGHYLPPDLLASSSRPVPSDQLSRADIYSLACSILEVASGKRPEGSKWGTIFNTIQTRYSQHFIDMLAAMLHPDPFQRPSADQLLLHPLLAPENHRMNIEIEMLKAQLKAAQDELVQQKSRVFNEKFKRQSQAKRRETFHGVPSEELDSAESEKMSLRTSMAKVLSQYSLHTNLIAAGINPNTVLEELVICAAKQQQPATQETTLASSVGVASADYMSVEPAGENLRPFSLVPLGSPSPSPAAQCQSLPSSPFTQNPRSASKRALKLKMQTPH